VGRSKESWSPPLVGGADKGGFPYRWTAASRAHRARKLGNDHIGDGLPYGAWRTLWRGASVLGRLAWAVSGGSVTVCPVRGFGSQREAGEISAMQSTVA